MLYKQKNKYQQCCPLLSNNINQAEHFLQKKNLNLKKFLKTVFIKKTKSQKKIHLNIHQSIIVTKVKQTKNRRNGKKVIFRKLTFAQQQGNAF